LFISVVVLFILYDKYRKENAENKLLLKVIYKIKEIASEELETIDTLSIEYEK